MGTASVENGLECRYRLSRPSVSVRLFFYSPDLASVAAAQGIRSDGSPVKRVHRVGPVEVVRDVEVRESWISPLVQVVLKFHG